MIPPGSGGSIFGGLPNSALRDGLGNTATLQNATTEQLTGLVRIVSTTTSAPASNGNGNGAVVRRRGRHQPPCRRRRYGDPGHGRIDRPTYAATVVGADAKDDVALLQLQNASGRAAPLATSAAQWRSCDRVGDADGLRSAVSGNVTALQQAITTHSDSTTSGERLRGMIEIDADVIAGDSGGATLNSAGQSSA